MVSKKHSLSGIILILFLSPLFSLDRVSVAVSPNPVGINDNFTIEIDLDHSVTGDVIIVQQKVPEGIQLWRGPYIRPRTVKTKEGVNKQITRISYTFRGRQTGRIIFEPFLFSVKGEAVSTPPFIMEIGNYINRKLVIPLEAEWVTPYDFVYTGESVSLLLNVYNQKEIGLFDSVGITPPSGGIFQEYDGLGEISSASLGDEVLYNIPAASCLFTPTTGGRVTIPSARVVQGESAGETGRYILDVMQVPGEIDLTGAIGRFSITSGMDRELLYRGDEVFFKYRVAGIGNLNYLQIPEVEFEGASVLSRYEEENYSPDLEGFKGYRENVYTLKIDENEQVKVTLPPFPHLERPSGRIIPSREKVVFFDILPAPEKSIEEEVIKDTPLPLLTGENNFLKLFDYNSGLIVILWFLPGPLVFFIFRIVLNKKRTGYFFIMFIVLSLPWVYPAGSADSLENPRWERCSSLYKGGDFPEAMAVLEEMDGDITGSAYLYNTGVIYRGLEKWDEAVYHLASAVEMAPMNTEFRFAFEQTLRHGGINNSYPILLPLDHRLFTFLLAVLVNLAALFAILYRLKPGGVLSIMMILTIALILGNMVVLATAGLSSGISRGVVITIDTNYPIDETTDTGMELNREPRSSIFLKKIPKAAGADWFPVKSGTVLRIRDEAGEFLLVENSEKITGWIHRDGIRRLGTD